MAVMTQAPAPVRSGSFPRLTWGPRTKVPHRALLKSQEKQRIEDLEKFLGVQVLKQPAHLDKKKKKG